MYVNAEDKKKELEVVEELKKTVMFGGFEFRPKLDPLSLFDFWGYHDGSKIFELDVKCRDINSDEYEDYFVSKEKADWAISKGLEKHFVAYKFKDGIIRVYDLNSVLLKEHVLTFNHKRGHKILTQKVYKIDSNDYVLELKGGAKNATN